MQRNKPFTPWNIHDDINSRDGRIEFFKNMQVLQNVQWKYRKYWIFMSVFFPIT